MKLKYTEILKKINQQSNKLVLEYDKDIEDILKAYPLYLKFIADKLQLKKKIEEKYKHLYAGNIETFNLYLESLASDLVFSKNDKNKELSQAIKKEINDVKPDLVYIIHFVNKLSPSVITGANKMGIPVVLRLSDYFLLCPRFDFMYEKKVCEECLSKGYKSCIKKKIILRNIGNKII